MKAAAYDKVERLAYCQCRWLLDNDHDDKGIVIIGNLYGEGDIHNPKARDEYREIKMNVLTMRSEGERSYLEMFKRYSRRVFIAMSAQSLAQLNGINVISYYAPLVFESAGWVGRGAILMTGVNALTYLGSTIPPWYLVDRWGRRLILLSGAVAMLISLSAIAYFIYLDVKATPTLVVISVIIYNAAFGATWGPIPWLYPPEILPLSIRAKGASLSTAANWLFNWVVGEMTPILQEYIQWRLYLVHAGFCALSFVVGESYVDFGSKIDVWLINAVWFVYPETANVRLEDMDALFGDAVSSKMATPAAHAEVNQLYGHPENPYPVQGFGQYGNDNAIPGLDVNAPVNGLDSKEASGSAGAKGVGSWLSRMMRRTRSEIDETKRKRGGGSYRQLEEQDD